VKIILGLLFCLAAPGYAQVPPYSELPNPRLRKSWICDQADLLTDQQEMILNQRLSQCERSTSAEICLVTLKNCNITPKSYAGGLFNHWGVGKKDRNNGILFLVVMDQRRMEIEAGLGLESQFSSSWCSQMLTEEAVPRFREGHPERALSGPFSASSIKFKARPSIRPTWS
jgi:uncharacterized protein